MSSQTGKRAPYTASACTNCKRRKARCSGGSPCAACVRFQEQCVYVAERDARKSTSVAYVLSLEARIKQLEAELQSPLSSSSLSADERYQGYQSRILALERGLSSRGISVSEVLEEGRSKQEMEPTLFPTTSRPQPITTAPSSLGKRPSTHDVKEEEEDEESGWLQGLRNLQLDESSHSLRYHGASSALLHPEAETSASPPLSAPISASLDFSPPPFSTSSSFPPYNPFALDFLGQRSDEIDWSKNLPTDLGIDLATHDALLDLFEAFFAPWCVVVDMPSFRRDMRICLAAQSSTPAPSRTDFYSPMLHNAILALACNLYRGPRITVPFPQINSNAPVLRLFPYGPSTFLAEAEQGNLDSTEVAALAFYNQARASLELECENPMLSAVRGLICASSFQSNLARLNVGYLYFGIALRCATALGVNISTHGFVECGIITDEIRQARDSVFHTATVQDSLWSLAVGRYPSFRHAGQDIAPPEVRPEDDARPWLLPSIWEPLNRNAAPDTSGRTLHPHSNMPSLISTTFVATADLALIQSDLIHELYWNKLTPSSPAHTAVVTSLGHRLESFAAGLPAELKIGHFIGTPPPPHVLTLNLMLQKVIMLLHRPSFHRPNDEGSDQAIRRCCEAANRVVQLVELYDSLYGICYGPLSNVQTIFIAGTVLLLSAKRSLRAAKRLKASLDGAELCCAFLLSMSQTWKWASRTHGILRNLVRRWNATSPSPTPADPLQLSSCPALINQPPPPLPRTQAPPPSHFPLPQSTSSSRPFGQEPYDPLSSAAHPSTSSSTLPPFNYQPPYAPSAAVPPPHHQPYYDPSMAQPPLAASSADLSFDFDFFMGADPLFGGSATDGWNGAMGGGGSTGFGVGADPWILDVGQAGGSTQLPQPEGVEPYVP